MQDSHHDRKSTDIEYREAHGLHPELGYWWWREGDNQAKHRHWEGKRHDHVEWWQGNDHIHVHL
jgi:hypothetical protein